MVIARQRGRLLRRPASKPAPSTVARATPASGRVDDEQFARDLGLMLRSGLGVIEALRVCADRADRGVHAMYRNVVVQLEKGTPLASALHHAGTFGSALVATVRASEGRDDLGEALHRYAEQATALRALRSRMVSSMVYPAMLIMVAGLVVVFLLLFVVPRFALVLESGHQELPFMTQLLVTMGRWMSAHQAAVMASLAGGTAGTAALAIRSQKQGRLLPFLLGLVTRIPAIGQAVRTYSHARFARSGGMLVRSGVPALQALRMAGDLLLARDAEALDLALKEAATGNPLGDALQRRGLLDVLGERIVKVAERTGQLDIALERLADVLDHQLQQRLDRAARLIEPTVMIVIGLVIGGIVVLMYLPIFQLAASVQ